MKSQYKALLIILILVLVELFKVYSQTYPNSITTSSDESGSSPQRIARDNVSLLPGFKFIPTSTTQWLGKTDENIVNDVVYQTPPVSQDERDLDLSLTVGTVPSQFDVSPTGAATYSIPIDIATGTAGMQQNLSVVYPVVPLGRLLTFSTLHQLLEFVKPRPWHWRWQCQYAKK